MVEKTNYEFVGHIIKDVFDPQSPVVVYGTQFDLVDTLRLHPEFGVETWGLQTTDKKNRDHIYYWNAPYDDTHFGRNYAELIVSLDYKYNIEDQFKDSMAVRVHHLLKDDHILFLVDPGNWADSIHKIFSRRYDLEAEVKQYSMFTRQNVFVYQK